MIKEIKKELYNKLNKEVEVVFYESRNKKIKTKAKILKLYENVFILSIDDKVLCFSYSDVLIKKIIIK